MPITGLDTYFAKNIGPITISRSNNDAITVTVRISGSESTSMSFPMYPIQSKVNLRLRDGVCGWLPAYTCIEKPTDDVLEDIVPVLQITDGTYHVSTPLINGGYDTGVELDEAKFLLKNFLTFRPQECVTYHDSREQLDFATVGNTGQLRTIKARIYFRTTTPMEIVLGSFSTANRIYRLNVSASLMEQKVLEAGLVDEIVAYDIFGTTALTNVIHDNAPFPQRFVIGRPNNGYSHFVFQNTIGGFDTVTSKGVRKTAGTGDIVVATNNGIETEIANQFSRQWEVNTGYIASRCEASLWLSFLRSTNRYVVGEEGILRKIIVSEFKSEYKQHDINSFTFTYHYAEPDNGAFYQKQALPDFIG